jgi:hypothetical protein
MFSNMKPSFADVVPLVLGLVFPPLVHIPNKRTRVLRKLTDNVRDLAEELYRQAKEDKAKGSETDSKSLSIVGTLREVSNKIKVLDINDQNSLVKSETAGSALNMDIEEIMGQVSSFSFP